MSAILKLIFGVGFNPLYIAIAAVVLFGAGAASGGYVGWQVNGWRLSGQIEAKQGTINTLEANNAILTAANDKCGIDVAEVRKAVQGVVDAGVQAAERAAAEMKRAAATSAGHLGRAENILNRPPVPLAEQCAAIQKEQREYVEDRRSRRSK